MRPWRKVSLRLVSEAMLLASLALAACRQQPPPLPAVAPDDSQVDVRREAVLHETVYAIEREDCRLSWTLYEPELNRNVIRHRAACTWPLERQVPLIRMLADRAAKDLPGGILPRTLSWGRLFPDPPRDSTMALRLAIAAWRSGEWDTTQGRPKQGGIGAFVIRLGNEARIYAELEPLFRERSLTLQIVSGEKVLVLPANELPFYSELRREGVSPGAKLPFDFQTWFALEPVSK